MGWIVVNNGGRLEIWTESMEWPGGKEKVYGPTTYEECIEFIDERSHVRVVY